ncbi:PAS domain-containing sensor histidine kinase [Sphingomonas sp. LaA6.9]|uniref:sensor histidine kinase n=1 Tax=Sphingomonas sp. LaA6.9 TaxID=2919914 RepID=UPI001F4F2BE0|nr:ATP-binding protein [Sphingomonas sp. LaA6.9]MCJ8156239.1 ATP-binding protein [Sphingomonas sp. LaA6.9]
MDFDRRFAIGLGLRIMFVFVGLSVLAWSLVTPDLGAARVLAFAIAAAAGAGLWRYIQRTNFEVARFVEAIRFNDLQARFSRPDAGSGFEVLGDALDAGIRALRDDRARLSEASRFYEALVDDVPVALLTIDAEGRVDLANKTARKLFNRHGGARSSDFECYGRNFAAALASLAPGSSQTLILDLDVGPQRAMLRAGALARLGGTTRVIAVQVIQQALNAVEVAAQSDLIRVLTHEIMNSMTPVTSLARTAAQLIAEADKDNDPAIADARAAVETLARRADGVMHFVETYREITRPPQISRRIFAASPFATELQRLFEADGDWEQVALSVAVAPQDHLIDADPDLLAQVVINLLRNAADAATMNGDAPKVALRIEALRSGRTRIEVEDNGAGVPEALRHDIFLPFFTTKKTGTGVGLSFARQVLLAHDGSIEVDGRENGGALFRLVL